MLMLNVGVGGEESEDHSNCGTTSTANNNKPKRWLGS